MVGVTSSYGQPLSNTYLVKTDSLGRLEWQRTIGTFQNEVGYDVAQAPNGDIFVLSETGGNPSNYDQLVTKTDPAGNIIWSQAFGSGLNERRGSLALSGNDVVVAATRDSTGNSDIWLFKVSNSGNLIWSKLYAIPLYQRAYSIAPLHDGGYLICGQYTATAQQNTAYAIRTDAFGDTIWTKVINNVGTSLHDIGFYACDELQGDSILVLVGRAASYYTNLSAVTLRLDGSIRSVYISNLLADVAYDVEPHPDGGFLVAGIHANFGGSATLSKFSMQGGHLWTQRYYYMGGSDYWGYAWGTGVLRSNDNGIILAGGASIFGDNNSQALLIKTNYQGSILIGNPITPVVTSGQDTVCAGDSVTIEVPDLFDHYQWFWYKSGGRVEWLPDTDMPSIVVDSNGAYRCVMWSEEMNTISGLVSVVVSTMPDSALISTGPLKHCLVDDNIQLKVKQVPGTLYSWTLNGTALPGNFTTITPQISGVYAVTMSNVCGTTSNPGVYVSINSPPYFDLPDTGYLAYWNGASAACSKYFFGLDTLYNTSYNWYYNGNPLNYTYPSLNTDDPGYYYVVAQNSCGTAVSDTAWLLYDTTYSQLTFTGDLTGCANSGNYFRASDDFYYALEYRWYKDGSYLTTTYPPFDYFNPSYTSPGLDSGYYFCVILDTCGNVFFQHQTDSVYYRENSLSKGLSFPGGSNISCSGNPITITASASGQIYQWLIDSVPIPGANSQSYVTTVPGYYQCLITAPCGQYYTNYTNLQFGPPVNPTIVSDYSAICRTSTDSSEVRLQVDFSIFPGYASYQWRLNGINIPGATSQYYETKIPGLYDCVFTNICGNSISNVIFLPDYYISGVILPGNLVRMCSGVPVALTAAPGYYYQWYKDYQPIPGATDSVYWVNEAGGYAYYVKISNGSCTIQSEYVNVSNQTPPVNFILPETLTEFCGNDSVKLNANERFDYSYTWYRNGIVIPGITSFIYYAGGYGDITVSIADSIGCTTVSPPVFVSDISLGAIPLTISSPANQCIGDTVTISAPNTFVTYQWMYNNDTIPGATGNTLSTDTGGVYKVFVSNGTGCTGSGSASLNFLNYPQVNNTVVIPAACNMATGKITITVSQFSNVSWYGPNGFIESALSTYFASIDSLASGWYIYTVENYSGGCQITDSVFVPATSSYQPQIYSNDTSGCQGQYFYLNAGANYPQYLWSTGQTTYSIVIDSGGTYVLTVTDPVTGCTGTDSISINIIAGPAVNILTSDTTFLCDGDSILLDAGSGFGPYQWSNGMTTQVITVSTSGIYVVTVTDPFTLCTTKDTVEVGSGSTPPIALIPSGYVDGCAGDTINLVVTPPGYSSYLWNTGDTTTSISVVASGTYILTVIDSGNICTAIDSVTVNIHPLPVITASAAGPVDFCIGDSVLLSISGSAGSYQWYKNFVPLAGYNGPDMYVHYRGNYSCLLTDAFGCSAFSNSIMVRTPCVPPQDPIEKLDETLLQGLLSVYPNPGNGFFNLRISGDIIPEYYNIFDASGRLILTRTLSDTGFAFYNPDLSHVKGGVYFLHLYDVDKTTYRLKIIKL